MIIGLLDYVTIIRLLDQSKTHHGHSLPTSDDFYYY